MINKLIFDWSDIESCVAAIRDQVKEDQSYWQLEYIVGLTRGGLIPAVMLSHALDIPCHTLKVQLRDGSIETNAWMSEDAYNGKNILIVDDINDTGATFEKIKFDWKCSCYPDDPVWNSTVWGVNVKFAALVHNQSSTSWSDYYGHTVDKSVFDQWIEFPWEKK